MTRSAQPVGCCSTWQCWIRGLGALLGFLGGSAAGADPLDLAVIADVMAAREEATLPVYVSYSVAETLRGDPWPPGCLEGKLTLSRQKSVLRVVKGRNPAHVTPDERVDVVRVLWTWDGTREYHLSQRGTTENVWHGTVRAVRDWKVVCSPEDFSLSDGRTWYSAFPTRPSARLVAGEKLGSCECVRVVADRFQAAATGLGAPVELWLDPQRGYLPVKVVFYRPKESSAGVAIRRQDRLALDGREFESYMSRTSLEVVRCGDGWLASRGEELAGASRRRMAIDHRSLRQGAAVSSQDFAVPEIADAKVLDETGPGPSLRSFAMTDDRLDQIVTGARADRIPTSAKPLDPGLPGWVVWVAAGVGVVVGLAIGARLGGRHARIRRRRAGSIGNVLLLGAFAAFCSDVAGDDETSLALETDAALEAIRRCGSNCAYVALGHFGKLVAMQQLQDEIAEASGMQEDDAQTLSAVRQVVERHGLHTYPIRASIETIASLDYPAIVFLPPRRHGVGHFIYTYVDSGGSCRVVDPPKMPRDLVSEPPDDRFVALLLSSSVIRERGLSVADLITVATTFLCGTLAGVAAGRLCMCG